MAGVGFDAVSERRSIIVPRLVPRPVMPPSLWVASTKPEAALRRGKVH
jgi:hypothetical protein